MAFKPVKAPTARAFPTSSILTLTAGVLAVVAFFWLPLITIPQITNITISLYYVLTLPSESGMIRDYFEPLGAVMLVLFGLLAPKLGKRANLVSLLGALLVFTFVVWSFVTIPSTLTGGAQLGLGFWTMIVAGILGLAGAIMGLRGR